MVRQATRTSQAAFLSTVLPVQDLAVENNGYVNNPLSPPITPNSEYWSSKIHPISSYSGREPSSPPLSHGSVTTAADLSTLNNSSSSPIGSAEDKEALGRWASLQRLQDQSSGLGGAAEHQLSRALELCRGLQGLKVNNTTHQLLETVTLSVLMQGASTLPPPPTTQRNFVQPRNFL